MVRTALVLAGRLGRRGRGGRARARARSRVGARCGCVSARASGRPPSAGRDAPRRLGGPRGSRATHDLARTIGGRAMRYGPSRVRSPNCNTIRVIAAAIDVGTNTTRLLVARVEPAHLTALCDRRGDDRPRHRPGGDRARSPEPGSTWSGAPSARWPQRARAIGAERIAIACTAVGRDAANAPDLLARIERATGVTPTVLSGEREAALTVQGIVAGGAADELVAADLGGGSLELMGGSPALAWATSLPLGVRKLTERSRSPIPRPCGWERSSTTSRRGSAGCRRPPGAAILVTGGSAAALAQLAGPNGSTRRAHRRRGTPGDRCSRRARRHDRPQRPRLRCAWPARRAGGDPPRLRA